MAAPAFADEPGKPLVAIMPLWLVRLIAAGTFLLAVGLVVWALLQPRVFNTVFARFLLCFGFAFLLGLSLFIIYPWGYRLEKVPGIGLPVELAGPVVLLITLFLFLQYEIPRPAGGQEHDFRDAQNHQINGISIGAIDVEFDGPSPDFYALIPAEDKRTLRGIYIHYPETQNKFTGRLRVAGRQSQTVTFAWGDSDPIPLQFE